jgi:transposase
MKRVSEKEERVKNIFCAIDLHDKTMLAGIAIEKGEMRYETFNTNEAGGLAELIRLLKRIMKEQSSFRVWVSYEASGCGFRFADIFEGEGFRVSVLAPSHLPSSTKSRSNKTDKRDVIRIMDVLRGHVMAASNLPEVWIPPKQIRDDREIVRQRILICEELTRAKNRIHGLLKRNGIKKPTEIKSNWTKEHMGWLEKMAGNSPGGCSQALMSLMRNARFLLEEKKILDNALAELAGSSHYEKKVKALTRIKGVALLTAMTFLTELGDMKRFRNRRQVGSYLGLTPRSYESGEQDDRKGHISRLGPSRVRKILNQAAWSLVIHEREWREWFRKRTSGNNKVLRKKMITAVMRKLGIWMWHVALEAA